MPHASKPSPSSHSHDSSKAASANHSPNELREQSFAALARTRFDLLVIGGGILGCGIARDAALRGYSVAVVEKDDFAAGTSSRSTKLIHGGLRYLEQAQFKLVFESTNERALLMRLAPHLVKPLPFLVPAYKESRHGLVKLDVGLWIYDAMVGFSSFKLHRTYRGKKVAELEPGLRTDSLKGGIVYYDCMTDDARLTLENALDARALGSVMLGHARATRLLRDPHGQVCGAEIQDVEPGSRRGPIQASASVVVNATGPWTDEIRALLGEKRILKPTKGVHLVVDSARLPLQHAILMLGRRDHRVMFAIPWGNRSVVGTTDTFFDGSPDQLWATREDVDYLLETANHYFPAAQLTRGDVLATWAGLRPLIAPEDSELDASGLSREQQLFVEPGLVTIAGGKLTTYRRISSEVVDEAVKQLHRHASGSTAERSLPGATGLASEQELDDLAAILEKKGLSKAKARLLTDTYGIRAQSVADRAAKDPSAGELLDQEQPYLAAAVDEAVEVELARTVTDVLARRVPLLLRGRDQGLGAAPRVARRMARLLDWNEAREREELDRYQAEVALSRRFRGD